MYLHINCHKKYNRTSASKTWKIVIQTKCALGFWNYNAFIYMYLDIYICMHFAKTSSDLAQ